MKLKKILALALSGILAVSMLAGCGGAAGSVTNDNVKPATSAVIGSVNSKLGKLNVKFASDSDFASQLAIVANSATLSDVSNLSGGAYLTGNAQAALTYVTGAKWMQSAPDAAGTYVCGIWFDGGMSGDAVATAVANNLNLAAAITEDFNVTKSALESYKVTVGTGASEKTVWLVGILVTLETKSTT